MKRFRYRTKAMLGTWRWTRLEAALDAMRAGQATIDHGRPDGLLWRVAGRIEYEGDVPLFGGPSWCQLCQERSQSSAESSSNIRK